MNFQHNTLFPEVLSTTQDIELYQRCNYLWFLTRCARYHKYVYNNDLEAGSEFAKAMEITRNAYFKEGKTQAEAVLLGKQNILTSFGATYASSEWQDELKTPEKLAEVFEKMFEEHPLDETSIIPFEMSDGSLSVEQDFSVELPFLHPETGKPLILKCKLDLLGTKDNLVYVVDEKTAKSVLADSKKQFDLLRTQNQFVQYVTVANMNKEKFGNLEISHVRINKCVIKKSYKKDEQVVTAYDFYVDTWFQKTWWNNLLYIIQEMLNKYELYKMYANDFHKVTDKKDKEYLANMVIFPRDYSLGCTAFFRPCKFTLHCTSGNAQDLFEQDYKQVVCDSRTNFEEIPLTRYKKQLLGG